MATEVRRKWSKKKHAAPTHVWYGQKPEDLPYKKLADLEPAVFASYSGPDVGLAIVPQINNGNEEPIETFINPVKPAPPPTPTDTADNPPDDPTDNTDDTTANGNKVTQDVQNTDIAEKVDSQDTQTKDEVPHEKPPNGEFKVNSQTEISPQAVTTQNKCDKLDNETKSEESQVTKSIAVNSRLDNVEKLRNSPVSSSSNSGSCQDSPKPDSVVKKSRQKGRRELKAAILNGQAQSPSSQKGQRPPSEPKEANVSQKSSQSEYQSVAGCLDWKTKHRKAYGISMSLYDQHPIKGSLSGDPIADSFALCARRNNALLVAADGVNWGEKSKMAARCAVYGAVRHLNYMLYEGGSPIKTTYDAFLLLLKSFEIAHSTILKHEGGLTTLCVALVVPLLDSKQYAVCIVNVGDSLAYVFSKRHGVREVTVGSHDISSERDIRDAGGALGPVNGTEPELRNLTCSMTIVDPHDIIYLTTDGISDNFDPVVTKIAVARKEPDDGIDPMDRRPSTITKAVRDGKPEMSPHERHLYVGKEMERIIHEFELFTEQSCSAQELCGALLQHVLKLTDTKRKVLENPNLYGRKMKSKERQKIDAEIVAAMSKAPGKLDHATIVAYEVGIHSALSSNIAAAAGDVVVEEPVDDVSDDEFSDWHEPRSPYLAVPEITTDDKLEDKSEDEGDEENNRIMAVSPTYVIPIS